MSEQDVNQAAAGHGRLHHAKDVVVDEFRKYLVSAAYIWVMLTIFVLHEEIALRTHGGASQAIPFAPHGFAIVNALVLGKVALVVEDLRLGHRIKASPLIWPIVLESAILALLFIGMHYLEVFLGALVHGAPLSKSVPMVGGGGASGVLFAMVSFFVAMLPFVAFRQLTLAIGWPRMRAILFGSPDERGRAP